MTLCEIFLIYHFNIGFIPCPKKTHAGATPGEENPCLPEPKDVFSYHLSNAKDNLAT
jgi:hypothetical protein